MIVTRLQGGLGNQLFQYACGRALALKNNAPLALDLTRFRDESFAEPRPYLLNRLNIQARPATQAELWLARSGLAARALARLAPRLRFQIIQEQSLRFCPQAALAQGNVYLIGYWQSARYFESCADLIRHETAPIAPPCPQAVRWLEEIENTQAVSVHVRRGDYAADPRVRQVYHPCSPAYYRKAAGLVRSRMADPFFLVFSDDPAWARENIALSPGRVVEDMPLDRPEETLRLMRRCHGHIIANSTFSWWGAWLAEAPGKVVVAPSRWFATPDLDASDIVPDTWTRVDEDD